MSILFLTITSAFSFAQEAESDIRVLQDGYSLLGNDNQTNWAKIAKSEELVSWLSSLLLSEAEEALSMEIWQAIGPETLKSDARVFSVAFDFEAFLC